MDLHILPRHSKPRCRAWSIAAVALAAVIPTSNVRAMPDDDWCRITGNMSFDQIDRDGQVRRAVAQRRWDLVRRLFSIGYPPPANLEETDRVRTLRAFRSIQLIGASARGDLGAVNRLLAAGADPNAEGNLDYVATPLAMAALCDRPAVAERLIRGGARVNYQFRYANDMATHEGTTALMWASMGGSLRVVRLLLSRGARTDLRDSFLMHGEPPRQSGGNALDYAVDSGAPNSRPIQRLLRAHPRRR